MENSSTTTVPPMSTTCIIIPHRAVLGPIRTILLFISDIFAFIYLFIYLFIVLKTFVEYADV